METEYTNAEGVTEKPKQFYFFMQYWKLPRLKRNITNLYKMLLEDEKANINQYPTPSKKSLYNYSNRFDWDKRIMKSLYDDKETLMAERVDDDVNEYRKAQTILDGMFKQLEGMRHLLDWEHADYSDHDKISLMLKIQNMYNETIITALDVNVGLTEMISNAELLKELYSDDVQALPFDELLKD